jgi:hypothetical protein
MEKIKLSRYAYDRFLEDLSNLRKDLGKVKSLAWENPEEHREEIDRLSLKVFKMETLESKFQVIPVNDGEKTLQIGYSVRLAISGQIRERVLDGYAYNKRVCLVDSPIGKEIINQPQGYMCGHVKILTFFIQKEELVNV